MKLDAAMMKIITDRECLLISTYKTSIKLPSGNKVNPCKIEFLFRLLILRKVPYKDQAPTTT